MSAPFEPNDVVVCVDDGACGCGCGDDTGLRIGRSYRIFAVEDVSFWWPEDPWNVILCNFDHTGPHHPDGASLGARRFRKIDDEVTEEFREQLRKLPVLEPAA
ncbi:hypothetical protein ACNFJ7_02060 [Sphingomonas sp. HT-1]|uniref:hypothetical protein n=1 Tax=unclassified Sphingomonas TaxID=196159 RepID=UPI0002DA3049|nr:MULTISPECIES: hypothetical protein [unclassified Sphingomonas]KTF68656.1 hypothetical protein ATB93_13095 [Sphingomonas sp. WG]